MKILSSLILLSTLSLSAHASFFIENCGNAEGTISTASGHIKPTVTVSERLVTIGAEGGYITRELDRSDINIAESGLVELSENVERVCNSRGYGHATYISIFSKKIKITNRDGSAFSGAMVNVSDDGLIISDYVICKREISNQVRCD